MCSYVLYVVFYKYICKHFYKRWREAWCYETQKSADSEKNRSKSTSFNSFLQSQQKEQSANSAKKLVYVTLCKLCQINNKP
jgi:hypothetical protein